MTKALPYQEEGIRLLRVSNGRCMLADDPGLGKTFQALRYALEEDLAPVIVVCPQPLKLHWWREAWQHNRWRVRILEGQSPYDTRALAQERLIIVNWDILPFWAQALRRARAQLVLADEVHVATLLSRRGGYFRWLCQDVAHVIGISATPLLNRPWELWPILNVLDPREWDSPFAYGIEYCQAERSFGKWRFHGARNLDVLHARLVEGGYLIRRLKKDVLGQLPARRRAVIPLEVDLRAYRAAEADLVGWLLREGRRPGATFVNDRRVRFTHLKHLAARLKLPAVLRWLDLYLLAGANKIIVGTMHHDIIDALAAHYGPRCVVIDGRCPAPAKRAAEEAFRDAPEVRVLFGNIRAVGVGLNFPDADVALAELPWTPGACDQLEGRGDRLTNTRGINVYYLVAHETVEARICGLLQRKARVLDQILDGLAVRADGLDIFDELQAALVRERGMP